MSVNFIIFSLKFASRNNTRYIYYLIPSICFVFRNEMAASTIVIVQLQFKNENSLTYILLKCQSLENYGHIEMDKNLSPNRDKLCTQR